MPALVMDPSEKTRTNAASKFTPFSLVLSNGARLAGISHIPTSRIATSNQPLIVGIHGGTNTAQHYDINAEYTASNISSALSVPFVAIDRPCYGGTDSFFPISEDSSFYRDTGHWLHEFIFPSLWKEFGQPNGCTGIVTISHGTAVPPSIIAAAMYAAETVYRRVYPLCGLILSGFGMRVLDHDWSRITAKDTVTYPPDIMQELMLSDRKFKCADPALEELCIEQTAPMPLEEWLDLEHWMEYSEDYVPEVNVPVMFALGEHDFVWEGTKEHIDQIREQFAACPRFDGSVVLGAPHALEWGYASRGWYARCFGWALEICAGPSPS